MHQDEEEVQRYMETYRQNEEVIRKKMEEKRQKDEMDLRKKMDDSKPKKAVIPKSVKTNVWARYIGDDIPKHKCLCCKTVTISLSSFHVGHVISEKNGGTHEINNLRPICPACNHSMGIENMNDFVKLYGYFIG